MMLKIFADRSYLIITLIKICVPIKSCRRRLIFFPAKEHATGGVPTSPDCVIAFPVYYPDIYLHEKDLFLYLLLLTDFCGYAQKGRLPCAWVKSWFCPHGFK